MSENQEMNNQPINLTDTIHEFDNRVRELESDIYDLKMNQSEMHRNMELIVSYLEAQASKGGS